MEWIAVIVALVALVVSILPRPRGRGGGVVNVGPLEDRQDPAAQAAIRADLEARRTDAALEEAAALAEAEAASRAELERDRPEEVLDFLNDRARRGGPGGRGPG